jgi:peptidoglycan hydrolase CwlO-like protein
MMRMSQAPEEEIARLRAALAAAHAERSLLFTEHQSLRAERDALLAESAAERTALQGELRVTRASAPRPPRRLDSGSTRSIAWGNAPTERTLDARAVEGCGLLTAYSQGQARDLA